MILDIIDNPWTWFVCWLLLFTVLLVLLWII